MASQHQSGDKKSGQGSSGNFANDPEKASEAGRKGGQQSHGGSHDASSKGQSGGTGSHSGENKSGGAKSGGSKSGNFADDPQRASEAGRKGGQHSHSK